MQSSGAKFYGSLVRESESRVIEGKITKYLKENKNCLEFVGFRVRGVKIIVKI